MSKKNKTKSLDQIPDKEKKLASWTNQKFKESMVAKQSYTARWLDYLNAWDNTLYENIEKPSYKTNHVSNFIYSSIESMRPILFDNDPRFESVPVTADAMPYSQDINTALDWEWYRTNMTEMLFANSIYTFTLGTSVIMLTYSYDTPSEDGDVKPIPVSPLNIYPDPLATSVDDAEYIIYANYFHVNQLKDKYPDKAEFLQGANITYSELVNDRDDNARVNNQVLVLETWCRDYTTIDVEEVDEYGESVKKKKRKYPKGRVIVSAPELGLILEDKQNPYNTGRFPFFLFKDIDVPFQFWGEGEAKWLLSPQKQINDLYNQVIDNAKATANMQWIIDKNAGIPKGQLTNRPGLIIRKNPGSDVHRESPPSMPMYVQQMIETLKTDVEVVSGVHDVTRGETPSGIQSAAAIQALQEAAQTRIRLKVALHENTLGELGTEWVNRMKQFWKFNRFIPKRVDPNKTLATPIQNGAELQYVPSQMTNAEGQPQEYESIDLNPDVQLKYDYRVKIIGASTMQQSRASLLDQMIRLMQTPAEDGLPCVPREAVLDYLPNVNKQLIMQHFDKIKQEQQAQQQAQQASNEVAEQVQQLAQQIGQLSQMVQQLQAKDEAEEQQKRDDEIRYQGYQQGQNDAEILNTQIDKSGKLPPELLEEIAMMDDEELAELMQTNPEIFTAIQEQIGEKNGSFNDQITAPRDYQLVSPSGVRDISYNPSVGEDFVHTGDMQKLEQSSAN